MNSMAAAIVQAAAEQQQQLQQQQQQQQPQMVEPQIPSAQSLASSLIEFSTTTTAQPTVQSLQHEIKDVSIGINRRVIEYYYIS